MIMSRAATLKDHPRSRGVYPSPGVLCPSPSGSSPLARGLLADEVVGPHEVRIIPARAGFTDAVPVSRIEDLDHPRSRGVYFGTHGIDVASQGSSPLARGLPISRCP